MKFNVKVIALGGLAYYVAQFVVSMVTGPFIHEGVLNELYMANASFWRPETTSSRRAPISTTAVETARTRTPRFGPASA